MKPIGSAKLASRFTSLLTVCSSVAKEPNSWRVELELSGQAWEVLAQHRQHLSAAIAGICRGSRHGTTVADD